jgi:hypothetical protein
MAPFVLCMTRVPLYISDSEIALMWKEYNGSVVKAVSFEPIDIPGYRKATVWFTEFIDYVPNSNSNERISTSILSQRYKKNTLPGAEKLGNLGNILGFLEPCSTPEEPSCEFSFMVALQLQDIVCQQATAIERLEDRLSEMEKRVHEGTELYLDIHQANMEDYSKMKSRLHYQKGYNKRLKANIIALQKSHVQEKNELKKEIDALTEWCSQPLWKRTSAFVFPKESVDEIISEF